MKKRFALVDIMRHIPSIMRRYIKHKCIWICLFWGLLPGIIMAQETNQYSLEGQVKIKLINKTAQDALQLYREIGATPQQIATPYMFLAFLGHPNYPAASPNENICILIYGSPNEHKRKYVFMVKLQEANHIKRILEGLGWGMEEYQGWSFFTKNKSDFQVLKDKNGLVKFASEGIKSDVEFSVKPSIMSLTCLKPDKELNEALGNLDKAIWNIDLPEGQIVINGLFVYKQKGPSLATWLEKYGNRWGVNIKVIGQDHKESKIRISLERKDIGNFINQLRAKVLSMECQ